MSFYFYIRKKNLRPNADAAVMGTGGRTHVCVHLNTVMINDELSFFYIKKVLSSRDLCCGFAFRVCTAFPAEVVGTVSNTAYVTVSVPLV